MAWLDQAAAAEVTNVSTPSGANHGGLVGGNIPCATSANQLNDCGKAAPSGAIVGTSDAQTLTNKTLAAPVLNGTPAGSWIGTSGATLCLLNANCTFGGLATLSGGLALPSTTNPTGSNFYVDANGNLHFVSPWMDAQLCGAKASGDATRCWFSTGFGSFITEASSNQIPNLTIDRNDYFNGGSGSDFGINETTNLGPGFNVNTTVDFPSGSTSLTVQANANIAPGQAVYGSCIPTGDTVSTYALGSVVLVAATVCDLPNGSQLSFINASGSAPNASPVGIQATVSSYTTGNPFNSVSLGGYGFKFSPSGDIVFGGNVLCHDYTGRKSSISGGGCLAAEMDLVASGPDDGLNRILNDDVFAESGPSADGATTIGWGIRLRPSGANAQITPNPAEMLYGFSANTMATQPGGGQGQYGSFNHAFFADGGELTGAYDIVSGTITPSTTASTTSGPNLVFALGTNVNVGQIASGTNIPAGDAVSAVYQCWASQPLAGCSSATNETLVVLAQNVTGTVANGATITFTGVMPDGSNFNGWFTDAFANWTNHGGSGFIKAGTTNNTGTLLDIRGFGEDSTNTTGVDYGDILFKETTNTHGAVVGEIDITPVGGGNVKFPDATTASTSGFTFGANVAMGTHNITGVNNLNMNGANASSMLNQAATATAPTLLPNRADTKAGLGADASGDVSIIADNAGAATEILRLTGTGASFLAGTTSLGTATATTFNKLTLTTPATGSTLTIADAKTLTVSNSLTLTATDGSTLAIGTGGTLGSNAYTSTAYAPLASPTFTGTATLPDATACTSSGCTFGANIAMGAHNITGVNSINMNNANGGSVVNQAATSTAPTLLPNRADTKAGIGAQASGNVSIIADAAGTATEIERVTSAGIILESGAYFSGATTGVTCSGSPTASFAATNGIVTHC